MTNPAFINVALKKFDAHLCVSDETWTKNIAHVKEHVISLGDFQTKYMSTWANAAPDLRAQMTALSQNVPAPPTHEQLVEFLIEALPDNSLLSIRAYAILASQRCRPEEAYEAFVAVWLTFQLFLNFNAMTLPPNMKMN